MKSVAASTETRGRSQRRDWVPLPDCFTDQMGSIRLETVIAAPVGNCFGLSLPVDAHAASMRVSGEQAIGGVTSGAMKLGDSVTWRARHFGICVPDDFGDHRVPADRLVLAHYMPHLLRQRNRWLKTTLEQLS